MMRSNLSRVAATGLAAVLLAACGGGGGGGGSASKAPTKAEFVKAADKICKKADDKFDDIDGPSGQDDYEGMQEFSEDSVKLFEAALTDLRKLEVPEGDEEDVEEVYDGIEKQIKLIEDLGEAAEDEDDDRINEIFEEGEDQSKELDESADDYGFKVCGREEPEDDSDDAAADEDDEDAKASDRDEEEDEDDAEARADRDVFDLETVEEVLAEKAPDVEFTKSGEGILAEDSEPAPVESGGYEVEGVNFEFEILVYEDAAQMQQAKPTVIKSIGCGSNPDVTCTSGRNVILVMAGDDTDTRFALGGAFGDGVQQI